MHATFVVCLLFLSLKQAGPCSTILTNVSNCSGTCCVKQSYLKRPVSGAGDEDNSISDG